MTLVPAQVTEVWAPGASGGMVGSGYLIDGKLVLTAGHVVDRARGRSCKVRPLGTRAWLEATMVWRGAAVDAALLSIIGRERALQSDTTFGRLGTNEWISCRAVGFPSAQAKAVDKRNVRDTEDLFGEIAPLAGHKGDLLVVHIAGSVPLPDASGRSPWEGMSGAAVFAGGLLVAVVVLAPEHFGTDRLEAVPVSAMSVEIGFGQALAGDATAPMNIPAVEDVDVTRGVLLAPYRPLPSQGSPDNLRGGLTGFLLEPAYGIVPYHGRDAELRDLTDWCRGEPSVAVRLITGRGGIGKTRLAAELCARQELAGTVTGILDPDASREGIFGLADVTAPLLVVVDEAQSRVEEVSLLLSGLSRAARGACARVLLLTRQSGDWWPTAFDEYLDDDVDARFLLAHASQFELQPVDTTLEARQAAFQAAVHAFAKRLARSLILDEAPLLAGPEFEPIFFVQLAALTAVEGGGKLLQGPVIARDLLRFALDREARYWRRTANARRLTWDREVLRHAVTVATLTTAVSHVEATRALTAVPDLDGAAPNLVLQTARWLRDLYPPISTRPTRTDDEGAAWFRPLAPDPLAEALIARVLDDDQVPEFTTEVLQRAKSPTQIFHALAVLTHTARGYPSAERALRENLARLLPDLWEPAMTVAQAIGDPIGALLAEALERTPNPDIATGIERALPEDTVALRELAVVATEQALQHSRGAEQSDKGEAETARLANDLADRLARLGRPEQALDAVEEAAAIRRRLANNNPDAYLPALATSLNNQSNRLSELGRDEQALEVIEEAVAIRRRLAEKDPDAFSSYLASSLNNQSNRLSHLKRYKEAVELADEAVTIYSRLARENSDAFLSDFASSLNNQSVHRATLGRHTEALDAIEQAVQIYRRLADDRPDAFLPNLENVLNSQSNRLSAMEHHESALGVIQEAVEICRRLATARPDAFLPDLAMSLNNESIRLLQVGRRDKALKSADEAVEIYRRLADRYPEAYQPKLVVAIDTQQAALKASEILAPTPADDPGSTGNGAARLDHTPRA